MSVIRTVFLGTSEFAQSCLQGLLEDEHFQVVAVITQPDRPAGRQMKLTPSPVKELAKQQGLEVLTPESVNTEEVLSTLADWNAEAAVVVAFGQILSQRFLDLFPQKVVNVHASLLPRWRGAAPIQRAIMAGDRETGVSLQVMTKKLDAGGVLGWRKVALDDEIDSWQLHEQLKSLARELLHVEFMDYLRGHLVPQTQDELAVTYAKKIEKSEGQIDWHQSAPQIHNQVRGLVWGPGCYTFRDGKKLKIHRTRVVDDAKGQPGKVLRVEAEGFVVACGTGALKLLEVQPESKARQSAAQYLKGYPMKGGETLGSQN